METIEVTDLDRKCAEVAQEYFAAVKFYGWTGSWRGLEGFAKTYHLRKKWSNGGARNEANEMHAD